jgi:hypothetical protein
VVRDDKPYTLVCQLTQGLFKFIDSDRVYPCKRFVKKYEYRINGNDPCYLYLSAFAA